MRIIECEWCERTHTHTYPKCAPPQAAGRHRAANKKRKRNTKKNASSANTRRPAGPTYVNQFACDRRATTCGGSWRPNVQRRRVSCFPISTAKRSHNGPAAWTAALGGGPLVCDRRHTRACKPARGGSKCLPEIRYGEILGGRKRRENRRGWTSVDISAELEWNHICRKT